MKVAITGSTGLIGSAVAARLERHGHHVLRMTRGPQDDRSAVWDPAEGWIREGALDGLDAVVNLGGASIGEGRWSAARKRELRASRIDATRLLVDQLRERDIRPNVFVSSSAVGYYGDRGDERLEESAGPGSGFLADLCRDWEAEAQRASDLGARVVTLRTAVVFDSDAAAFRKLVMPFRLFAGGPLGSGRQWFPWIHLDDVTGVISHALTSDIAGAVNMSAPETVTNRALARRIGGILRRPWFFPVPPFALRIVLGEAANELLLGSQRVVPQALEESGYQWEHPTLDGALKEALGR